MEIAKGLEKVDLLLLLPLAILSGWAAANMRLLCGGAKG